MSAHDEHTVSRQDPSRPDSPRTLLATTRSGAVRTRLTVVRVRLSPRNGRPSAQSPVDIQTAPDGALYYASIGTSIIFRIQFQ